MRVDRAWLLALLERNPIKLMREHSVPVLANQWGVKRSVSAARGRLKYAEDVATLAPLALTSLVFPRCRVSARAAKLVSLLHSSLECACVCGPEGAALLYARARD